MVKFLRCLFALLFFMLVLPLFGQDGSGTFSRTPPAVYAEHLRPVMTDIATLLPTARTFNAKVSDGVVLLSERIVWIDEAGKIYDLRQGAYTAVTDSAIDGIAEDVFVFRPDEGQKIYLLDARTFQPDGEVVSVHDSGVFVQTPQRESSQRIYSGRKELKVVYPDIKAGSTVYFCVLIESEKGRVPGEFTATVGWNSAWPRHRNRYVLDAPDELAQRLTVATRGTVPPMQKGQTAEGRTRLEWLGVDLSKRPYEELGGFVEDVGPYLKLSSIKDWDAFADWYAGLVLVASELSAELQQQAAAWTHGIESREQIIRVLFEKVANDVRYTSINFGNGGVAPQECNVVWLNKYGDCKDKAALLRALLEFKGIRSHVALVNTDHLGLVEKQTPDYSAFTHAIVAIEDGQGGYLFCDPTLSFSAPGILSPGSLGRDVLVVDAEQRKGIWVRTAEGSAGLIDAGFELTLEPDGALRGWLTYVTSGYYGSSYMDRFRTRGRQQREDSVRSLLRNFYSDAEVVDFEHTSVEEWAGRFVLRVYFLVPGVAGANARETTLSMPDIKWLLPYLGNKREITRDAYVYPESVQVRFQVAYPEGWAALGVPRPFRFAVAGTMAEGSYSTENNTVSFSLLAEVAQARVTPAEFTPLYNAVQSLNTWLAQAVIMRRADSVGVLAAEAKTILVGAEDFPVMPTARGQLELAFKRFPKEKDRLKARQAIESVIQYFPKDDAVVFDSKMYLVIMDWEEDKEEAALKLVNELIDTYSHSMGSAEISWAHYIKGLCLRDLGRSDEALATFAQIAANEDFGTFRRSWSEVMRGRMLFDSNPQEAVACFRRAFDLRDSDRSLHFYELATAMLENGQTDELVKILKEVQAEDSEEMLSLLGMLLERSGDWKSQGRWNLLEKTNVVMQQLNAEALLGALHSATLQALGDVAQMRALKEAMRRDVTAYIEQTPPSFWSATTPDPSLTTREDFKAAVTRFHEQRDVDNVIRHLLEQILRFEPGEDFFTCLWHAASNASRREQRTASAIDEPLFGDLLRFGERIPKGDDVFYEMQFQRGRYYNNRNDFANELAVYRGIEDLKPDLAWYAALYQRMGYAAENLGDYDTALKTYATMLPLLMDGSVRVPELQLRAIQIHLNRDETEQALAIINALSELDAERINESEHEEHLREWIRFAGQEALLREYWARWQTWWPQWQQLAQALQVPAEGGGSYRIADQGDTQLVYEKLNESLRVRNSADFRESLAVIVDLIRWQPQRSTDLLSGSRGIVAAFPQHSDLWRQFAVKLYDARDGMPEGKWEQEAFLGHVIDLYELKRVGDSKLKLEAFLVTEQPRGAILYAANRLYSLAAVELKEDLSRAAALLEADLADQMDSSRAITVACLVDVYRAQGNTEAELALLAREIEVPQVQADTVRHGRLKARYQQLQQDGALDEYVQTAARQWLEAYGPKWFDYAKPRSLADPKLRNLATLLDNPKRIFSELEVIKLQFIALGSSELDSEAKVDLFRTGILDMASFSDSIEDWYAGVQAFIDDTGISGSGRAPLAFMMAYTAFQADDSERVEAVYVNRDAYDFGAQRLIYLESLHKLAKDSDSDSAESFKATAERLVLQESLNMIDVEGLINCISGLIRLGDIEGAKSVYATIAGIRLDGDARRSKAAIQMETLRAIRSASRLQPVHEVFREQTLALLEGDPALDAKASKRLRMDALVLESTDMLPLSLQWQTYVGMLAANNFDRSDMEFWSKLLDLYVNSDPKRSLDVVRIYAAAIEVAPGDEERARLLADIIYSVDYDDEAVQKATEPLLARWRDDASNRKTRDLIRAADAHIAMRKGKAFDDDAFARIHHPFIAVFPTKMMFSYYFINDDVEALKRELQKLDADKLTDPRLLDTLIRCLSKVQMEDELELVKETAREQIYEAVLNGWSNSHVFAGKRAIELAGLLGEPELIPQGFREHVAAIGNERARMMQLVTLAQMDKDWEALHKASSDMVAAYPTFYDYYWHLANALCQQGELKAAIEPLKLFIAHSGDSIYLPEAREWLKLAEAGSPPAGN